MLRLLAGVSHLFVKGMRFRACDVAPNGHLTEPASAGPLLNRLDQPPSHTACALGLRYYQSANLSDAIDHEELALRAVNPAHDFFVYLRDENDVIIAFAQFFETALHGLAIDRVTENAAEFGHSRCICGFGLAHDHFIHRHASCLDQMTGQKQLCASSLRICALPCRPNVAMNGQPPALTNISLPKPPMRLIGAVALAIVALILIWTSFYTVPAESEAVVLRFGKFLKIAEPGLQFKIPLGVDEYTLVKTRRQLKLEFGFYTPDYTNPDQPGNNQVEEKSMVTGDLNAALVEWVVQYRISDPKEYLFDVRNPGQTLRDLSEAAMREVIGDRTVDEVITIGRQDIEISALARMQELATRYKLGVRVDQVQLKNVNPPREVQASFNEVNKAQQDRENAINIANGDYNEAVPRARGQADQTIRGAEGYRFKRVNEAEGDIASFNAMLSEYIKAPEITRTRLYLETMQDVLPLMGPKIIIDDSMKQLLPILPLSLKQEAK